MCKLMLRRSGSTVGTDHNADPADITGSEVYDHPSYTPPLSDPGHLVGTATELSRESLSTSPLNCWNYPW